jgi:predicted ester cyclase
MSGGRKMLKVIIGAGALVGLCLGFSVSVNAETTAEEAANEAVVARLLEVKGTPLYREVAAEVFTDDHVRTRREFENLVYHSDDPILGEAADPDYIAITERVNTIERLVGDGDMVAAQIRVQGKHTGNLYGIPATGKTFDVMSNAVFRMEDGKIAESWWMLQESGVLMDLGVGLPKRVDGKTNLAPAYDDVRTFDEGLAEHLATTPRNTDEWHNKTLLLSYKALPENRAVSWSERRPYSNLERGGINDIIARADILGVEGSHGASMSNRRDMIAHAITNDTEGMILFRLTADNSGPLFGIPASGVKLHDWEIGWARFDGPGNWTDAWWTADELGFTLLVGGKESSPESLNFWGEQ